MEATAMITDWVFVESIFWLAALLLSYTYFVYPLIAILLGSGRQETRIEELPKISVLVPAHNEEPVIASKIRNFHLLDYPADKIELVIADDGSTDDTIDEIRPFLSDRVQLIQCKQRGGKAAAMNRLVGSARHEILLFTDANVMMAAKAIRRLVEPLANTRVGAVTGEVRLIGTDAEIGIGEALYYWMERRIQSAESKIGSVMGVDGGMYLMRRTLWQEIPSDIILDDFFVSMSIIRSNKRVIYESAAKATETGTPSAKDEYARRARIAAGAIQLLKRRFLPQWYQPVLWTEFISHKLLRWLSPILFACLFVSSCVLAFKHVWFQLVAIAQLFLYSGFVLTWACKPLRKNWIGGIIFYFGLSQVAMAVGLVTGMINRQTPKWEKGRRLNATNRDRVTSG